MKNTKIKVKVKGFKEDLKGYWSITQKIKTFTYCFTKYEFIFCMIYVKSRRLSLMNSISVTVARRRRGGIKNKKYFVINELEKKQCLDNISVIVQGSTRRIKTIVKNSIFFCFK